MKEKQKQRLAYGSLITVFILMCVLRLWFTLLIIFSFGLVLTLVSRRRSFCSTYCPMGTIQESSYRGKKEQRGNLPELLKNRWVKILVSVLFWGYLGTVIYLFHDAPVELWTAVLSLMLGSMAVALLLQTTVSKRVWCATLCPYGNLLGQTVKAVKKR